MLSSGSTPGDGRVSFNELVAWVFSAEAWRNFWRWAFGAFLLDVRLGATVFWFGV